MLKIPQVLLLALCALWLTACARGNPVTLENFDPHVYIVQTGDTVYSISWRYSQDFRDVISWNKLRTPYTIFPGQKLSIRGPAPTVAKTTEKHTSQTLAGAEDSAPRAAKTQALKEPLSPTAKTKLPQTVADSRSASKSDEANNAWLWPVKGELLTRFSASNITRQGIDIKGVEGATIVAARGGTVVYSGSGMRIYGRLIIIKHSETFLSAYAHNSRLMVVEGDTIKAGQAIARIGVSNQGVAKLHFEIRKNGKPVNPLKYLPNN